MKKIGILIILCVLFLVPAEKCMAASDTDSILDNFDFKDIDAEVENGTNKDTSFRQLVQDIIGGREEGISFTKYIQKIVDMLSANKKALTEILMIGILSAVLKAFTSGIGSRQLSDTAQMMISVTLVTILAAVYAGAVRTAVEFLDTVIHFYQSVCPVFFSAVMVAGGSISAGAYFQIVTVMIGVVNIVFKNVLIQINHIYLLLGIVDSITEEEHYSKACELAEGIIRYSCKTVMAVFLGLSGVKGMVAPYLDSEKKSILGRTLSMIPGVGNTTMTVSKTMIGAGTIVKNSIGAAVMIVIVGISAVPILKLAVLAVLYKTVAAVIEPIAGKGIVSAVNICSKAIGHLVQILLVTAALLIMTIGIICMTTSVGYGGA